MELTISLTSLGPVDPDSVELVAKEVTLEQKQREERAANKPPLEECLNLHDFEASPISFPVHLHLRDSPLPH